MRTETIIHSGATVVVRSAYRRTPIIEAQYVQALRAAYPEVVDYEKALYAVPTMNARTHKTTNDAGEISYEPDTAEDDAKIAEWSVRTAVVRAEHSIGVAYTNQVNAFVPLVARITAAKKAPFTVAAEGRLDALNVVKAFENYLDDEDDGLWRAIAAGIAVVDAPLTPPELRPPETLTAQEANDPFLSIVA